MASMIRQKILITGASSGLGAGMARAYAAKNRDLALCARRSDLLDELKAELTDRHPGITVATRSLDVTQHQLVPLVFADLSDEVGGLDHVIVNAGIAKGSSLGTGKAWANVATLETNLVGALVQIEAALEIFRASGSGHLVLVSSVLGARGFPGPKSAYSASKAGVGSLGESLRAEFGRGPIVVSTIEPGYVDTALSANAATAPLMVDLNAGVKALVAAIEREPGRAAVPPVALGADTAAHADTAVWACRQTWLVTTRCPGVRSSAKPARTASKLAVASSAHWRPAASIGSESTA
jgi:NADP-dependent 3-hydroxy acid dehydrogenase YdfG